MRPEVRILSGATFFSTFVSMIIQTFPSGPLRTNAYVIACPKTYEAAVIDPSPSSHLKIIPFLEKNNLQLHKILLTHSHWDHIADVHALKQAYGIPIYIHSEDAYNLEHPGSDRIPAAIQCIGVPPDHLLCDGEKISLGNIELFTIHTPGHSPGGVCFYIPTEETLIVGDTIFKGSIGTLSLPTSQPERMWPSLHRITQLPPQTKIYPGHGPSTTLQNEPWLPHAKELFGY